MSDPFIVHLFVEDRAHEQLLIPLVLRIAHEEQVEVTPEVRSARGGHGRVISELKIHQRDVVPDALVVCIDGNCSSFAQARKGIVQAVTPPFSDRLVVACPDPHIERWYLADPESFATVVGQQPAIGKRKCERGHYKALLARAVRQAGHPPMLGGIEFAPELVRNMDLYKAGKNDHSLKAFVDDLRDRLRTLKEA
jgi:hypothetical protein